MSTLLLALAFICVGWGVVSFIVVTDYLSKRGVKINFLLIRILMFKYMNQYHRMTKEERGKPGPWYYSFLVSMWLAAALVIIGLILRAR